MRLHLGMPLSDRAGWAVNLLEGRDWHAVAYRSGNGLGFVPFGQLHDESELDRLQDWLGRQPDWFRRQLSFLRMPDETIVVCDCPRMPAVLRTQVLSVADLVLMVTTPDSVSYAAATRVAAGVEQAAGTHMAMVLNGFDSSRQLDRDISLLMRTQHKQGLSPVVIHRDESLREAVACKQTVFEFAPSSQAAYDFTALATWTLARLGRAVEHA